jgi:cupin 2 domain-containing protein
MTEPGNLYANVPFELPAEVVEALLATDALRIERIISLGHASPDGFSYDQEAHEWVLLIRGAARLLFEGDAAPVELRPGDYLDIPAHRRHRVEWTDPTTPTIWVAIHHRGGRDGQGGR